MAKQRDRDSAWSALAAALQWLYDVSSMSVETAQWVWDQCADVTLSEGEIVSLVATVMKRRVGSALATGVAGHGEFVFTAQVLPANSVWEGTVAARATDLLDVYVRDGHADFVTAIDSLSVDTRAVKYPRRGRDRWRPATAADPLVLDVWPAIDERDSTVFGRLRQGTVCRDACAGTHRLAMRQYFAVLGSDGVCAAWCDWVDGNDPAIKELLRN
ncbi:MAG: hypothetical protein FJ276_05400 [Planctomycetes bacterium]|nr:hypothetical protein [Planctomycetota bacterium]